VIPVRPSSPTRRRLAVASISLTLVAASCGGSSGGTTQVASLGTLAPAEDAAADTATTDTVDPADTQEAVLAFAACMRENGVDMADPTFDADGNMEGGLGFGPDSGIDPRSDEFQAAQEACGDLMEGVALGGPRNGADRETVELALADYTDCLRDEGLDVDDIELGGPDGDGPPADGSMPTPADGSVPTGGFQGGPPPAGGQGGAGFDPTSRIVEQLGLDADDPAVVAALDACESILTSAFQQPDDTDTDGADDTDTTASA
jgi:hypothetical protein